MNERSLESEQILNTTRESFCGGRGKENINNNGSASNSLIEKISTINNTHGNNFSENEENKL